jgi:hypothetical protein
MILAISIEPTTVLFKYSNKSENNKISLYFWYFDNFDTTYENIVVIGWCWQNSQYWNFCSHWLWENYIDWKSAVLYWKDKDNAWGNVPNTVINVSSLPETRFGLCSMHALKLIVWANCRDYVFTQNKILYS